MASTFSQLACPCCQLDKSAFRCPSSCSRRPTKASRRCSSPAPLQGKDNSTIRGEAPSQAGWLATPPCPQHRDGSSPETVPTSTSPPAHTPHTPAVSTGCTCVGWGRAPPKHHLICKTYTYLLKILRLHKLINETMFIGNHHKVKYEFFMLKEEKTKLTKNTWLQGFNNPILMQPLYDMKW